MEFERYQALLWRVMAGLFTALVGLDLFLAAGTASFDGKRLDIETLAIFSGGISYAVLRLCGWPQNRSVDTAFVGTLIGAVYAAVTRDTSGSVGQYLIPATVFAAFAAFLRAFMIPWLEERPAAWASIKSRLRRARRKTAHTTLRTATASQENAATAPEEIAGEIGRMLSDTERRLRDTGRIRMWGTGLTAGMVAALVTWLAVGRE